MRILHRSTGASHPCPESKTRPLRLHTGRGRHLLIAGGISLRGQNRLGLPARSVPVTIAGRSHAVLLLEQLDKMGRIREIAVVPDLRDRFVRRNQQQARVHQSLTDEPLVGRFEKVLAELFLERGQAPVALAGQLLDRNIVEDIALNRLLEILLHQVHIAQYFAFETTILLSQDQIDQLGHLDRFRRIVLRESIVLEILVDRSEEILHDVRRGIAHMALILAVGTAMVVRNVKLIADAQVVEYPRQLIGGIVEDDLLEVLSLFGNVLGIVVSHTHVEKRSLRNLVTDVAVLYAFLAAHDVADAVTGKIVGLDSAAVRLNVLDNHGLLSGRCRI